MDAGERVRQRMLTQVRALAQNLAVAAEEEAMMPTMINMGAVRYSAAAQAAEG